MRLLKVGFPPLIAFVPTLLLASGPSPDSKTWREISQRIEALRRRHFVPGLSVAVVKDDQIVFSKGFGLRDVAGHKPVTPNTLFAIGSCSKAFTCLLATQAQVDKKLDLSKSPSYYLPLFKPQGPDQAAKLTVSDLMCHRSGFPRTDFAWWAGGYSGEDIIRLLNAAHPIHKVGQEFLYQNLMVTLAGMVDEKVYDERYPDLVSDKIFKPLGMNSTSAHTAFLTAQPDHATGYEPAGPQTDSHPLDLHNIDNVAPAGAIVSTAQDMAQWLRLQLGTGKYQGKQLFASDAILEQRKPRITVQGDMQYGYGWFFSKYNSTPQVDHGGNIDGFTAEVSFLPEKSLGVVILSNASNSTVPAGVRTIIYDALLPEPATRATPTATFADAVASVAGRYANPSIHLEVTVEKKGGKWSFEQGPVTLPLKLIADKTYAFDNLAAPKVSITFAPNEKDPRATDMVIEQSGMKFRLQKAPPYQAPLTGEELIAKVVAAEGGANAMAQLGNLTTHYHAEMTSEAVSMWGIRYTRNGHEAADFAQAFALGRKFVSMLSYSTHAQSGVALTTVRQYPQDGQGVAIAAVDADELALLHPKSAFLKTTVIAEEKVGAEDAYVLDCVSKIAPVELKLWVSKKTFLVLKRANSGESGATSKFSDYRPVAGTMIPFHEVATAYDGAETVVDIDSVDLTSRIPDWPFKMPAGGKL